MPLITIKTSAPAPVAETTTVLLKELSSLLAELLSKPERYVMTALEAEVPMTFAGDTAPACSITIKSIGSLDGDRTRAISAALCGLMERHLQIPPDRTYIGFDDVPGRLWGWNGGTFG